MKYAIVLDDGYGNKYLMGFTNEPINEESDLRGKKYTVELRRLDNLFIRLEGDAAVYLH